MASNRQRRRLVAFLLRFRVELVARAQQLPAFIFSPVEDFRFRRRRRSGAGKPHDAGALPRLTPSLFGFVFKEQSVASMYVCINIESFIGISFFFTILSIFLS